METFNVVNEPYVDHIGNAKDMSMFNDDTFDEIYASHILEYFNYFEELTIVLKEWNRILKPNGKMYISVPNLDVLSIILSDENNSFSDIFKAMRMMFGGQVNEYDVHKVGFNFTILNWYLARNGFKDIQKVDKFNIFKDSSEKMFLNKLISLNVIAYKK